VKLSIITITCRQKAALGEMARTIAAAAKNTDATVEWIIVDEHEREAPIAKNVEVLVVKPVPSEVRPAPATARARNTGLGVATGDYVIFLDDNHVITEHFLALMAELCEAGQGYRPNLVMAPSPPTFVTPEDGVIGGARWEATDKIRPSKATSVSSCFGALMSAFQEVNGFDESFDGESKWGDTECAVRLERSGVHFVATKRVAILILHRSKDDGGEIVEPATNDNAKHWGALLKDRDRIEPLKGGICAPATPTALEALEPEAVPGRSSSVDSGNDNLSTLDAPASVAAEVVEPEPGDMGTTPDGGGLGASDSPPVKTTKTTNQERGAIDESSA